jgi:hypothetical protein
LQFEVWSRVHYYLLSSSIQRFIRSSKEARNHESVETTFNFKLNQFIAYDILLINRNDTSPSALFPTVLEFHSIEAQNVECKKN